MINIGNLSKRSFAFGFVQGFFFTLFLLSFIYSDIKHWNIQWKWKVCTDESWCCSWSLINKHFQQMQNEWSHLFVNLDDCTEKWKRNKKNLNAISILRIKMNRILFIFSSISYEIVIYWYIFWWLFPSPSLATVPFTSIYLPLPSFTRCSASITASFMCLL